MYWKIVKTFRDDSLRDIETLDGRGIAENVSIERVAMLCEAPRMHSLINELSRCASDADYAHLVEKAKAILEKIEAHNQNSH